MSDNSRVELEATDMVAKTLGTLVNRYIEHPHADGYAIYKIVSVSRTKATIEVVEIDDAWVLPAWGRQTKIPLKQAQAFVDRRDLMANLFARTDNWWVRQPVGSIVHYSNGHDQFVRGRIVVHEGRQMMLPIALVGSGWRTFDLWTRSADGSVRYGYHTKQIKNAEPFQPNASNMVECSEHSRRYHLHPRELQPVDIDPPTATPAQIKLAEIAKVHQAVIAALDYEHTADPVVLAAAITAALKRAQALLAGFEG